MKLSAVLAVSTTLLGLTVAKCAQHESGDYWTGISDPNKGGCAWYFCSGDQILKWIDCGRGACRKNPSNDPKKPVPGCA